MKNISLIHKNFLKKQNEIYKTAFGTKPAKFICDPKVCEGVFAYTVVWEYPNEITSKIEAFGSVIIASEPDINFTEAVLKINESAKKIGIDLKLPWGSHITVARFIKENSNTKELEELLKSAPELESTNPISIMVAYGRINMKGFTLNVHKKFPI